MTARVFGVSRSANSRTDFASQRDAAPIHRKRLALGDESTASSHHCSTSDGNARPVVGEGGRPVRLASLFKPQPQRAGKARPASPARAASTPASSASNLVWNAISSMAPMILPIWFDELAIAPIASIACLTTIAPFLALLSALATSTAACLAPSADFFSVAVI